MQEFSTDWFSRHIPLWEIILTPLMAEEDQHVLEIGCFEGQSTSWLLDNIVKETGHIWCVDPWTCYDEFPQLNERDWRRIEQSFDRNVGDRPGLTKIKGRSRGAIPYLMCNLDRPMDLVYVDGAHNPRDCLLDLVLGWEMLDDWGILIADDYVWEGPVNPQKAIDAFLDCYTGEYVVLHKEIQVILRKVGGDE